jgi:hypothetical protein
LAARAREDSDGVRNRTKELVELLIRVGKGNVDQHSLGIEDPSAIVRLIEVDKCSLNLDVLPTVERVVPKLKRPLGAWAAAFLLAEIRHARDDRLNGNRLVEIVDGRRINPRTGYPDDIAPDDYEAQAMWNIAHSPDEMNRRLIEQWKADPHGWFGNWGPPPGKRGCAIPERLLIEAGIEPYHEPGEHADE